MESTLREIINLARQIRKDLGYFKNYTTNPNSFSYSCLLSNNKVVQISEELVGEFGSGSLTAVEAANRIK